MSVIGLWWLSLAIFVVVVAVVAVLLVLIIIAARRIDHHAEAIWIAGKQIAGNTVSIWMLAQANQQLADIAGGIENMQQSAASIDDKLGQLAGVLRSEG